MIRIGITPEHCGLHCTADCAKFARQAVRRLVPDIEVVDEDCGPWNLTDTQRAAVERAMSWAEHARDCQDPLGHA